jgi:Fe-S cluster assembly ATPase SufC
LGSSIRYIEGLKIRRELQTVRLHEAIGDGLNVACEGLETIYLVGDAGSGTERLEIAVLGVGEPEVACGVVLTDVIKGREVAAVEIIYYWL